MEAAPNRIEISEISYPDLNDTSFQFTKNEINLLSGPSACGKTYLAVNVIEAESNYRLAVLNQKATQLANRPTVAQFCHLPPSLTLRAQESPKVNESIIAFLGLDVLLAKLANQIGSRHCPLCGGEIVQQTSSGSIERLLKIAAGKKIAICATIFKNGAKKQKSSSGELEKVLEKLTQQGFSRFILNGQQIEADQIKPKVIEESEGAFAVVDRLTVSQDNAARIADSINKAAGVGLRLVEIFELENSHPTTQHILKIGEGAACQDCGYRTFDLGPELFDFNFCKDSDVLSGISTLSSNFQREFLAISFKGKTLDELCASSLNEICDWLGSASSSDNGPVLESFSWVTGLLCKLGLGYLSFSRRTAQLSSGEWQRLRIAQLISRQLPGLMYIIDMPGLFLHPDDRLKVAEAIRFVHSHSVSSTYLLIDNNLEFKKIATNEICLKQRHSLAVLPDNHVHVEDASKDEKQRAKLVFESDGYLSIKPFKLSIPVSGITLIQGVSGSGKTLLALECLAPAIKAWITKDKKVKAKKSPEAHLNHNTKVISAAGNIQRVLALPIQYRSENSRASLAQHLRLVEPIAKLYAMLPLSKQRGYSHKSFTDPTSDLDGISEVRFKGYSFNELLKLSALEASLVLKIPAIKGTLQALALLGLEYLPLNQLIRTLSTSEWQRLRLVPLFEKPYTDAAFIVDYPCAGLDDQLQERVAVLLGGLAAAGNTLVISDNSDYLSAISKLVIDMSTGLGSTSGSLINLRN